MTDKDESEIIGEAIIADLSEMFDKQITEDGVSPLVIVRALITVGGNIGGRTWASGALPGCFVTSQMCSSRAARNLRTNLFENNGGGIKSTASSN